MKFGKLVFAIPILLIGNVVHAATPLYSTPVDQMLKSMIDATGKFTSLKFADGTTQSTAGGGATSFSQLTGSATTAQLPSNGIVIQTNGTSTGQTATNLTITTGTATNLTIASGNGTFTTVVVDNLTVNTNLTKPANENVSGSKTVTIGGGNSYTDIVMAPGTRTFTGSGSAILDMSGGITIGTTTGTSNLAFIPATGKDVVTTLSGSGTSKLISGSRTTDLQYTTQHWAVGSSSVSGTSQGTFTTMAIPGNQMGRFGLLEIYPFFGQMGTTTICTNTIRIYVTDGVATATVTNATSSYLFWEVPHIIRNQGSTSVNCTEGNVTTVYVQGSTPQPVALTLNTGNTMTVSFCALYSTATTIPLTLLHANVRTTYIP